MYIRCLFGFAIENGMFFENEKNQSAKKVFSLQSAACSPEK